MGNGTKVALVALLIVMVVVVARFVNSSSRKSSTSGKEDAVEAAASKKGAKARATLVTSRSGETSSTARSRSGAAGTAESSLTGARQTTLPPLRAATSSRSTRPTGSTAAGSAPREGNFVPLKPLRSSTGDTADRFPIRTRLPSSGTSSGASAQGAGEGIADRYPTPEEETQPREPPISVTERKRQDAQRRLQSANVPTRDRFSRARQAPRTETLPPLGGGTTAIGGTSPQASTSSGPIVHELEKGESYWSLAKKYYDRGALYPLIEEANRGIKLHPGNKVTIPALTGEQLAEQRKILLERAQRRREARRSSESSGSSSAASRGNGFFWYTAKRGDTLSGLAKRYYGNAAKFHLIEEANPELKYTSLQAGERIKIPEAR